MMEFLSHVSGVSSHGSAPARASAASNACGPDGLAQALERFCRELGVSSAWLFLRQPAANADGFVRVAAFSPESAAPAKAAPSPLRLPSDAFLLRRLRRLSGPLCIEPDDLRAWERAVEANAVPGDQAAVESRRAEIDLLRAGAVTQAALVCRDGEIVGLLLLGPRVAAVTVSAAHPAATAPDRGAESRLLAAACGELARLAQSHEM